VLAHFGRRDGSIPLERAEALIAEIRGRGVPAEMHVYEADHAFVNDQRPAVHDPASAALAWERTVRFLRETLGAPATAAARP
jgi:carboxymethylenebutenolidase